jgi:WD40 repeat protein
MTTGSAIGSPLQHRGTVQCVAFSRDRRTVLTGSLDRTARIWNAATGEPLSPPIRHIGRVMAVAISPDGRQIVTGCHDGTIWLWAVGGRQASLVLEHENRVWSAAFTPDGEGLLTASGNMGTSGTAQLWNAASGERIGSALPHDSMVREIAISADGRTIMTGSWTPDSTVRIWNAATQEPIGPPIRFGSGGVTAVALDPRGRAAATACMGESFAQVWDLAIPSSHAISFPGRDLLAARFQLKHDSPVRSIAFSRDGRLILTGSYDGIARQWDAATGQSIGEPLRHRGQVGTVAFSRDSKFILTGTDEGHAQLWHADSGRSAGPPLRHDGTVRGVAFSPDGQWLATASWDKTARVWHAATCKPVGPALRHASEVESVTFSPDGRSVVTASWDQTARFWPMIRPIYASLNEVVVWVETITGMKLDTNEAAEVLDARAWERRHNHVRSTSVSATAGSLP